MILTPEIEATVAHKYALDVLSGEIVTGEKIKLQVKRYFNWIENAEQDGYYIDHKAGIRAVNFYPTCLNHTKGALKGQPFELAPFQQFTIYNLFAWKNINTGFRRINTVMDKRAKKNGKTAEMAGLGLLGMSFDNEASAEIYVGATKEEQAKLCWEQAGDFISHPAYGSEVLTKIGFRKLQSKILFTPLKGMMRALGGDSKTQDGINAHISIIDEYHAHKDDSVKENLESSSVQRTQPITYHITTAGSNTSSVCKRYENTCIEILNGIKKDDHLWIMIHDLDDGDDWNDKSIWVKANPLLGQGLSISGIEKEYIKAVNQPSKVNNFKTKHLNMWVDGESVWITNKHWLACSAKPKLENFIKYGCAGGLDLSTNIDLTAMAFVSNPDSEGYVDLIVLSFCPLDRIDFRSKTDRVPYRYWSTLNYDDYVDFSNTRYNSLVGNGSDKKLKILTATPGNVVDYETLEDYGIRYYNLLKAKWVDYDRKFSDMIVNNFENRGMKMHPFSQVMSNYSFPTKEFERKVLSGKVRHGGNPLLTWSISGVTLKYDTNENCRPDKELSTKRIDPIVASIMAFSGVLSQENENLSKYEKDGADVYF